MYTTASTQRTDAFVPYRPDKASTTMTIRSNIGMSTSTEYKSLRDRDVYHLSYSIGLFVLVLLFPFTLLPRHMPSHESGGSNKRTHYDGKRRPRFVIHIHHDLHRPWAIRQPRRGKAVAWRRARPRWRGLLRSR